MPRVISDELFEQLIRAEKEQRLLGVMGMLYELRREAVKVFEWDGEERITMAQALDCAIYIEVLEDETKTNNN